MFISGGTSGIGRETVKKFVELEAKVIFTGRSETKANLLLDEINLKYPDSPKPNFLQCDYEDLNSIELAARIFNENHDRIDVLLNNAGALVEPGHKTKDNFDANIQANYLAHYY